MPAQRRASIRELTSAARELDAGVVEGHLHRDAASGDWVVREAALDDLLSRYEGQEVVIIIASFDDQRPMRVKICRTCGTEYVGATCPRCREARIRLRGR